MTPRHANWILLSSVLLICITEFSCYPSGAPNSGCATLTPLHSGTQPREDVCPFTITLLNNTYKSGEIVTIRLQAPGQNTFIGFLAEVRTAGDLVAGTPIGLFESLPFGVRQACQGGGATHDRSSIQRNDISFNWRAPAGITQDLVLRVTFLEAFNVYWVGVASEVLRYESETTTTTTTVSTTATTTPATTTTTTTLTTTTIHTATPPTTTTTSPTPSTSSTTMTPTTTVMESSAPTATSTSTTTSTTTTSLATSPQTMSTREQVSTNGTATPKLIVLGGENAGNENGGSRLHTVFLLLCLWCCFVLKQVTF